VNRSPSTASMTYDPPPFPDGCPPRFRATVHGLVFADRARLLDELMAGDPLAVVADPPGQDEPGVWLHTAGGDPVGHLPPEIARWLWPWLRDGGHADAVALRVGDDETPSWRRLVLRVECRLVPEAA